ncbi:MAG TPA: hypothetical protein H9782_10435 [Candidatus Bariatricus faecipullorum]|nr:hypothetical protein [Candidatus Bariatricus faecipullorum]
MGEKLPYYMVYPEDFLFDDSRKDWRDYEYLKSLYPDMAKRILPFVEEECDRMEADSSMIYDEYPDKLQLRLMCGRICNRVKEALSGDVEDSGTEEETGAKEEGPRAQEAGIRRRKRTDHVREMTELLLYQELLRRRSHRRRGGYGGYWTPGMFWQ